jgi:peptide/nickel transport system permease protein
VSSLYIIKRLFQGLFVLFLVSMISFTIINTAPGDPALALFGNDAQKLTNVERERINHTFGVDQPAAIRYLKWAGQMMKGDMGVSYREGRKVFDILVERLPNTLLLFSCSIVLITLFSILLGIKGGHQEESLWGKAISIASIVFSSIPVFWFGILCMMFFSVYLHLLPSSGTESLQGGGWLDKLLHLILPVLVMTVVHVGIYGRFIQEQMKEESRKYYVQLARANGMKETYLVKGMLKNALLPYIQYLGMTIPSFFGGSIVIESLFSWAGLGQLSVKAAMTRDYPLLMGCTMMTGTVVIICILLTDLLSFVLNPMLRRDFLK